MDGRDIMEGLAVVKAMADTVRSLGGAFFRQPRSDLMPVYRLVSHEGVPSRALKGRSALPKRPGADR